MATRSDRDFDLAKQIRITERNKRISKRLVDERELREQRLPFWALGFGVAFVVSGLALAINVVKVFR